MTTWFQTKFVPVLISLITLTFVLTSEMDLAGFHLTCCCADVPGVIMLSRNATGHVLKMSGLSVELLDWVSKDLNVTYDCAPVSPPAFDNTSNSVGGMYYIKTGVCDISPGPVIIRYDRYEHVDFLHPWIIEPTLLVIPLPAASTSLSAIWQPFQFSIWAIVVLAIITLSMALFGLDWYARRVGSGKRQSRESYEMFLIGLLFSQAGRYCPVEKFKFRVITGAWCLVAMILTTAYGSILTSFIMAIKHNPLVNSVQDLSVKQNVKLAVVRNWATDVAISKSDLPIMKKLARKLASNPFSRCPSVKNCLEQVKKGSTVFIHNEAGIFLGMSDDFRQTGRCNIALTNIVFGNTMQAWPISRIHRLKFRAFNRAMLRMIEVGLPAKWQKTYQPRPERCLNDGKTASRKREKERGKDGRSKQLAPLGLMNYGGTFIALLIGYIIATTCFLAEKLTNFIIRIKECSLWTSY